MRAELIYTQDRYHIIFNGIKIIDTKNKSDAINNFKFNKKVKKLEITELYSGDIKLLPKDRISELHIQKYIAEDMNLVNLIRDII